MKASSTTFILKNFNKYKQKLLLLVLEHSYLSDKKVILKNDISITPASMIKQ